MIELGMGIIFSSFIAGIITFLAPCTLPLVPAYLGFISGVDPKELQNAETRGYAEQKIFKNGIFFILGFTLIFIVFGLLAGLLGQALAPYRVWFTRIGGVLVILFGLFMLGVFRLSFLQKEYRINTPRWLTPGRPTTSFAIGSAFAFGWTPCVGPILGSILLLASSSQTALSGGILLLVFSAGLALPFLFVAFAYSKATRYIERISVYLLWVSRIGGVLLIMLGILLMSGNFSLLIQYGFEFLEFLNYTEIERFL